MRGVFCVYLNKWIVSHFNNKLLLYMKFNKIESNVNAVWTHFAYQVNIDYNKNNNKKLHTGD